ncbi:MAG: glucose-6-phosphate isomerase family protein [Clostridia bacterium]|nr:glucose-6-phosphate isomerase family protein [Clostridia bacterium]
MDFNPSSIPLDFERGFTMDIDLITGKSKDVDTGKRFLGDLRGLFSDETAYEAEVGKGNPLVYEFHGLPAPDHPGDIGFGCSIVYPGKVGNEYYMTKGHFHTDIETGEAYLCLNGHGYMLIENPEGDWRALELAKGKCVYVPKRYAHRSICVGTSEPLVTFFAYRANAGHDYGSIETRGFRKLMVEVDGKPAIVDNPKW